MLLVGLAACLSTDQACRDVVSTASPDWAVGKGLGKM